MMTYSFKTLAASASSAAVLLLLAGPVQAHMEMSFPPPFRSKYNTNVASGNVDFSMTSPLDASGANYPCKGYQSDLGTAAGAVTASFAQGAKGNVTIVGGATHNGGSCQISLSADKAQTFTVIQSIVGGCPTSGGSYDFTIPSDSPTGEVLLAWSWQNNEGNREFYENCAAVTITGGSSSNGSSSKRDPAKPAIEPRTAYSARPAKFLANLGTVSGGCGTVDTADVIYPNPGPDVTTNAGQKQAAPTGSCGAGSGGSSGGSGSSGSPGGPGSSAAAASSTPAAASSAAGSAASSTAATSAAAAGTTAAAGAASSAAAGSASNGYVASSPSPLSSARAASASAAPSPVGDGDSSSVAASSAMPLAVVPVVPPTTGGLPVISVSITQVPVGSVASSSPPAASASASSSGASGSGPSLPDSPPDSASSASSSAGGVFVTAGGGDAASGTGGSAGSAAAPTTLATVAASSASPGGGAAASATGGGSASSSPSSSTPSGGLTGACTNEGDWNCVGGGYFQRCASGAWSSLMPMVGGETCTVGESSTLSYGRRRRARAAADGKKVRMAAAA